MIFYLYFSFAILGIHSVTWYAEWSRTDITLANGCHCGRFNLGCNTLLFLPICVAAGTLPHADIWTPEHKESAILPPKKNHSCLPGNFPYLGETTICLCSFRLPCVIRATHLFLWNAGVVRVSRAVAQPRTQLLGRP